VRALLRFVLLIFFSSCGLLACKSECSKQSDCNVDGGQSCLYPVGAGCSAQGYCEKQDTCTKSGGAPPLLCGCSSKVTLAPECLPGNGLTEPTTNGMCSAAPADAGIPGDGAVVDGSVVDADEQ
jgi:hypothetical protein